MPWVPNEVIRAFSEAFDGCTQRVGGGKVAVDAMCVRRVVREAPEAAYRTVEIYCAMAQSQPGVLKTAAVIGAAYQVEFDDAVLLVMVSERARELGV